MEGVKENPDVEDIRAKRKTYKRRTVRNIAKFPGAVKGQARKFCFFILTVNKTLNRCLFDALNLIIILIHILIYIHINILTKNNKLCFFASFFICDFKRK